MALEPGKPTRQKRSRKKEGVKPGRVSWIHGTKLKFFASRADEWKAASEADGPTLASLYTKVTNLYGPKYGYDMADGDDLDTDVEDPTDPDAKIPGSEKLSEEEEAELSAKQDMVRKRIAVWYCRTYHQVDERDKNLFADVLVGLENTGPGCPHKAQPPHYYSRNYYEERVKSRFNAAWAVEAQRAKDLELEKGPSEIKIRNKITRLVYEGESEAWELTRSETRVQTAEEMNAVLKNAVYYLDPLAEAIAQKFGLNCSILLCGPMGDRGGVIKVRSVHAGRTQGLAPRKWFQLDPMGYEAAEKSMIKFSERCFSEEECRTRTMGVEQTTAALTVMGSAGVDGALASTSGVVSASTSGGTSDAIASTSGAGRAARGDAPAAAPTSGVVLGSSGGGGASGIGGGTPGAVGGQATPEPEPPVGEGGGGEDESQAVLHEVWKPSEGETERWTPELNKVFGVFATAKEELGPVWGTCVRAWVDLEAVSGFDNKGGQLTTDKQPKEIKDFIRGGCRWYIPKHLGDRLGSKTIPNLYVAQWWEWWGVIQPEEGRDGQAWRRCMGVLGLCKENQDGRSYARSRV
ncbi:hypothetical protein B0H16DRAFT_1739637 [Mycena metata]|uniref:Uncharacterized protein n=1 Tax=Mycena metata TaxID=1033252 RepID=A0AAD7HFJ2_9AGAR|nr:hypothetical protein B0H16DRAFT_1739637 [Mycena metata]